jgi:hypothetical protein
MAATTFSDFAFDKLDRDLVMVMEAFQRVLTDLGEGDLARSLPWTGSDSASAPGLSLIHI